MSQSDESRPSYDQTEFQGIAYFMGQHENIKTFPDQLLSTRLLDRIEDELQRHPTGLPFEYLPAHEKANFASALREILPILIREYRVSKGLPQRSLIDRGDV